MTKKPKKVSPAINEHEPLEHVPLYAGGYTWVDAEAERQRIEDEAEEDYRKKIYGGGEIVTPAEIVADARLPRETQDRLITLLERNSTTKLKSKSPASRAPKSAAVKTAIAALFPNGIPSPLELGDKELAAKIAKHMEALKLRVPHDKTILRNAGRQK